jgi:predicted O-methyltransferase YrrM
LIPHYDLGDWHSDNIPNWKAWLAHLVGKQNLRALEIGSCEGRSALWLMDNVLTDPSCILDCVDPFEGAGRADSGISATYAPLATALRNFEANIEPYGRKINHRRHRSDVFLPYAARYREPYDFIYIDGSHLASDVLSDSVLSWPLLKPGGVMIWDDYRWCEAGMELEDCPQPAINAFLSAYRKQLVRIPDVENAGNKAWQVCVRKLPTP